MPIRDSSSADVRKHLISMSTGLLPGDLFWHTRCRSLQVNYPSCALYFWDHQAIFGNVDPMKQGKLTLMLSDSLGGNCKTAMLGPELELSVAQGDGLTSGLLG